MANTPTPKPENESKKKLQAVSEAIGARVVHELRNSLAVVSSSLFLARRDRHDEQRLLAQLDKASQEVHRAQAVVAGVLALSRGDTLVGEDFSIASLVGFAQTNANLPSNLLFSLDISPPDLLIHGDPILLERLLINLFLNAAEAMEGNENPTISVSVVSEQGDIVFSVEDNGPGIPEELHATVFDPLVTTKPSGTGLGLALVRGVARAHRGDVEIVPTSTGIGTCFRVCIPAAT
jgi:signal transduction histidine kinase